MGETGRAESGLVFPILSSVDWELGSSWLHQWERADCYTQVA